MSVLATNLHSGTVYDGGWVVPRGGDHAVRDAATGAAIGRVGLGDAADVENAGRTAADAQPAWAARGFDERAAIMRRAADALETLPRADRIIMQREEGAIAAKIDGELRKSAEELRAAAGLLDRPTGELLPHEHPDVLSMARRIPVGVVGVIAPWNAPLLLAMRAVAPALALGNAVVLKPDPKTAVSGGLVIARAFEEAGLPPGVLHVLPGGPATGEALVASPHTQVISFTGSTAAGRRVGELAGRLLKRAVLELGGNNALIVLEDADLDEAVRAACRGSLLHNGQICMATGRHLVHESIAEAYVERLREYTAALRVGDPTDPGIELGPLISTQQAERVQGIVDDALAGGAELLVGGRHDGPFFTPTLLVGVEPGNAAFDQEIFGPVMAVTTFGSDEEAVTLANRTEYGLAAAVHTADLDRALRLAARLRTGMVHVNGSTIADAPHAPMGGMGQSGNGGRYGGHWNLDEFTAWQWVTARGVARR
ncbi:aldehyde dehydrogenase family protein [Agromyces archimandritae]|uniref:Aldehyde dehydrogenase family protein n=1 Tax=Agromyces archimandritae TaxID=2781962 RepID=A0A975INM6_9MICO|nr:aldehyde dehydrogenase family protein [Agromyces archimandritae]QTX04399.1 aldehyde dehydrogenase family protein [Agromyces archimandritae]